MTTLAAFDKPRSKTVPPHEQLLNEHQAAELLILSVTTLRSWRATKFGLAYLKLGGSVRYRQSDCRAFIEGNVIAPGKE